MVSIYDCIVIGAGQSGLAAAYYLQKAKLRYLLLERNSSNLGSWANYYENLKLFSPAAFSSLPGMRFPGEPNRYPDRKEVVQYLKDYASHFRIPVQVNMEVVQVTKEKDLYTIKTSNQEMLVSRSVICATGSFTKPYIPNIPGLDDFCGITLHSKDYMSGASFSGKKIIVVGGGNSAVQIAVELAEIADVTITTRSAIKYVPQRILGKDIHFWINFFRLDQSTLGKRLLMNSSSGVLDTGTYRNAIANNKPTHKEMFRQFTETGVIWEDGTQKEIDVVIFATGFVPNYGFLQNLDVLDEKGSPRQQKGISMDSNNLYFVGLPWQNSFASATIRGAGKDAKIVVNDLFKHLKRGNNRNE